MKKVFVEVEYRYALCSRSGFTDSRSRKWKNRAHPPRAPAFPLAQSVQKYVLERDTGLDVYFEVQVKGMISIFRGPASWY